MAEGFSSFPFFLIGHTFEMTYFKKSSKYGAKRVTTDGYSFASQLEAALYQQLKLEMMSGIWTEIKCQDHVTLTKAKIKYIPDFRTTKPNGEFVWHEAKGFMTPEYRLKEKLWAFYGPGTLLVYKGSARAFKITDTILSEGLL